MLLTVGTTEAVEAIAEAQENLQEVAKNCSGSFEFCTAGCHCGHRICSGS